MSAELDIPVDIENGTLGRLVVARLKPNQDLTESIEALCVEHAISRAIVRGAVGSLIDARLAFRAGDGWREQRVSGPGVEILNVFGEVDVRPEAVSELPTLHGMVADTDGRMFAGRFVRGGNLSFITIEVTLQEWLPA
ncbi:DNA-binding protein [Pandoraea sp. XJJ-1]|uniref:DNA-binding protein n=2 Tax=Pandoraea TaxID=93217 RepID=A0A5E4SQT5_9BURK|nr:MULTISPECIES: PPC domain-containing DNA-binding protein [Pandoraea]MBN9116933.1 DNA-binding protein [Pandoraea sp.]OJY18661.1 MAG: DNA-binding protein [Pandoraea sp. 64-18]WAL81859.1 DNA-binding protein [Pandoraea sp. XJJ-1]VVD78067.1 DNA-binding protein [Pandoraea terrigena]VVD83037.1 DNA-binding protein [Pandoraea cepalis]